MMQLTVANDAIESQKGRILTFSINACVDIINADVYAGEVAGECRRGRENRGLNVLNLGDGPAVVEIVVGEMLHIVPV